MEGNLRLNSWPTPLDYLGIGLFFLLVLGLPALGYLFLVLDVRAYLRALRGVLVRVLPWEDRVPDWVTDQTPPCLRALGLEWPCTQDEVKQAYRRLAQELHPDHGGDLQRFLMLTKHHDAALHFVGQRSAASRSR